MVNCLMVERGRTLSRAHMGEGPEEAHGMWMALKDEALHLDGVHLSWARRDGGVPPWSSGAVPE